MKRILCSILCGILVFALCSCGHSSVSEEKKSTNMTLIAPNGAFPETEKPDDSSSTPSEGQKPDEENRDVSNVINGEPTESLESSVSPEPIIEQQDEDPLAMLEVTESFAKGAEGVYLRRNGKLYTLHKYVSEETSQKYNVGWRKNVNWTYCDLYQYCEDQSETIVTFGDFDPPTLMEGDEIISFGNTGFSMRAYDFIGYSLPICNFPNKFVWIFESFFGMPTELSQYIAPKLEVRSENGALQEDYHNLEYGKNYTVSWFQGTDYHELTMAAICRCYQPKQQVASTHYDGTLTKNGYATYDLSGVEPGLYRVIVGSSGGFIIIP